MKKIQKRESSVRAPGGQGTQDKNGAVVVQLATRIPKELYREIKLHAVSENISISELVSEAMQDLLVKHGVKKQKKQTKEAVAS